MDFVTATKTCLSKYVTFTGRAARSEYWFFILFFVLLSTVATVIDVALDLGFLSLLVSLGLVLPGIAAAVRRLHDTDRSGWWYLIVLIPLGGILLLVWFCAKGTAGANRFGDDSLPAEGVPALA